jgi:hypothetical protein
MSDASIKPARLNITLTRTAALTRGSGSTATSARISRSACGRSVAQTEGAVQGDPLSHLTHFLGGDI